MGLPTYLYNDFRSRPVNGFVCFTDIFSSTNVCNSITVCNPITRQTVKLPDVRNNGRKVYGLLGYDPLEDQYKVLCVMMMYWGSDPIYDQRDNQQEHYVCTVSSTQKQEWRKIENATVDNYPCVDQGICINGAIYYGVGNSNIVRFDVRSEKMEMIKAPEKSNISTTFYYTLVNDNGRLGGVEHDFCQVEMRLWILEDVVKHEWSSVTFKYPCELRGYQFQLESKGVIHAGEIKVFSQSSKKAKPICVPYYDFNKESSRKVEIQVMETVEEQQYGTTLCYPGGYVENIRFL